MIDDEPKPPYQDAANSYSIWRINGALQFWNTGHRPARHPDHTLVAVGTYEKMKALFQELRAKEA